MHNAKYDHTKYVFLLFVGCGNICGNVVGGGRLISVDLTWHTQSTLVNEKPTCAAGGHTQTHTHTHKCTHHRPHTHTHTHKISKHLRMNSFTRTHTCTHTRTHTHTHTHTHTQIYTRFGHGLSDPQPTCGENMHTERHLPKDSQYVAGSQILVISRGEEKTRRASYFSLVRAWCYQSSGHLFSLLLFEFTQHGFPCCAFVHVLQAMFFPVRIL